MRREYPAAKTCCFIQYIPTVIPQCSCTGSQSFSSFSPLPFLSGSLRRKKEPGRDVSKNRSSLRKAVSVSHPLGSFPAKRALRPGMILASLASTDAPQCIASRHDLCRHCVQCSVMASLPPVIFRRITSWDALPSVTVLRLTECKKWSLSRKNVPNKCSRCAGCYYLD